jgi:hypothetical protein
VTFQAFIDDSGSGLPVFVLSGYISSVDWWESFSDEWQKLLDAPPKLPYFKMREAAKCWGGKMKADQTYHRIKSFVDEIPVMVQASMISVIPMKKYKAIVKGKPAKFLDDPYFVALFDIVMKLFWSQVSVGSTDTLEFIFDDNPRLAAKVPQYYQFMRHSIDPKYRGLIGASPKFEDDLEFLPLQAADMQSWYYRRLFEEKIGKQPFPVAAPKSLFGPLDRIPSMLSFWTDERLRSWANQRESQEPEPTGIPTVGDIHELLNVLDFGE